MKLIDRMLFNIEPRSEMLDLAFIVFDETSGLYQADCRLWDGIPGSGGRSIISEHKTELEAREAIDRIAAEYPNRKHAVSVIFDDMDMR